MGMLSAAQMARRNRLLAEALELGAAARQRWLEALPADDQDLEPALRRALLAEDDGAPGESVTLPHVGAGIPAAPPAAACRRANALAPTFSFGCWAPTAWPRCGWPSAPTEPSSGKSR